MTVFEIIMVGYIVNVGAFILLTVLTVTFVLFNLKNVDVMSKIVELEKLNNKISLIKQECRNKNISTAIQSDFSIFIPFAVLIYYYKFIFQYKFNLINMIYTEIQIKIDILEKRLNELHNN